MSANVVEGIVLQKIDYGETSLILKVLTADNGIQSFMFQGAKRKQKRGNLISSMAVLDITFYQRTDSALAKITSVEPALIFRQIPFDPYRSSVLFFINEVLIKVAKEKNADRELYTFIRSIIEILDLSDNISYLPIKFLYELTRHLGFAPELDKKYQPFEQDLYLDLQEGKYIAHMPNHPYFINSENSRVILQLARQGFNDKLEKGIGLDARRQLIRDLLKYYQIIFDQFGEVKSLDVLESTLHR